MTNRIVWAIVATVTLTPAPATACGGLFCNALTRSPIDQAGERVVFAKQDDGVIMHVAVSYRGEPTDFGWILPIPAPPSGGGDGPLTVDDVLSVSTRALFDELENLTAPRFIAGTATERVILDACTERAVGTEVVAGRDLAASTSEAVETVDQAVVGPYHAELIRAPSVDALYDWLGDRGYFQDPAARDVLADHVAWGHVFLGLRLANDRAAGDLQPIRLDLGPTDACIPLRLTAIAATPDMPIRVWVLGPGRATPKNFLHVTVNPEALTWPGAPEYDEVIAQAVDDASGRAFVTEYAAPAPPMRGRVFRDAHRRATDALATIDGVDGVVAALEALVIARSSFLLPPRYRRVLPDDALQVVRRHVPVPAARGIPGQTCHALAGTPRSAACDALTTTEEGYYAYLTGWLALHRAEGRPLLGDWEAVRRDLETLVFAPRRGAEALFASAGWLTRLYTTLSPAEMTRDPIFVFNDSLPEVGNIHRAVVTRLASEASAPQARVQYPNGVTRVFSCGGGPCFAEARGGAPAALTVEVLEEQGPGTPLGPDDVEEVDRLLAMAAPGQRSLPAFYAPSAPAPRTTPTAGSPQQSFYVPEAGACDAPPMGCASYPGRGGSPWTLFAAFIALFGLVRVGPRLRAAPARSRPPLRPRAGTTRRRRSGSGT